MFSMQSILTALPPPPAPAAPAPEPAAPLVAPAPEPAVVAPAPRVEQELNFYFCYKSSLAFRFRQLGFSSTFFVVLLAYLCAFHVFLCVAFLLLAIFGLGIVYRFLLGVSSFSLVWFSIFYRRFTA